MLKIPLEIRVPGDREVPGAFSYAKQPALGESLGGF